MLEVLDKFESGSLTSTQVEESMEFHVQALERIGMEEIDAILAKGAKKAAQVGDEVLGRVREKLGYK